VARDGQIQAQEAKESEHLGAYRRGRTEYEEIAHVGQAGAEVHSPSTSSILPWSTAVVL
jgi:hypothetical protein